MNYEETFNRLAVLTTKLDALTDQAAVEIKYAEDRLKGIGIFASVDIDFNKKLEYGRLPHGFGIYVLTNEDEAVSTIWSSCSRELKMKIANKLPLLLAELEKRATNLIRTYE